MAKGISKIGEILDIGVEHDIIEKKWIMVQLWGEQTRSR